MRPFNILFQFRSSTHIANVYFSSGRYDIYFTDVELVLEFGSKAEYTKKDGVQLLKTGSDIEELKTVITRQLEQLAPAA
jgi:hypothetical protein